MDNNENKNTHRVNISVTLPKSTLKAINESITDVINTPGKAVDCMIAVFCPSNGPDAMDSILRECVSISEKLSVEDTTDAFGLASDVMGHMFEQSEPFINAYRNAMASISSHYSEDDKQEFLLEPSLLIQDDDELCSVDMDISQESLTVLTEIQNRIDFSLSDSINFMFTRLKSNSVWMTSAIILWTASVVTARLDAEKTENTFMLLSAFLKILLDGKKNGFSDLHKYILNVIRQVITKRDIPDIDNLIEFPQNEE